MTRRTEQERAVRIVAVSIDRHEELKSTKNISVCQSLLICLSSLRAETIRLKRTRFMADDVQIKREITLEADAETMERMRKEGHARGFTVYCDEAERTGGDNSAPPPLAYFGLSLAF